MRKFKTHFYNPHTWIIRVDLKDKQGVIKLKKAAISSGNIYVNDMDCHNYSYLYHIDYARSPNQRNTHFEFNGERMFAELTDWQKLKLDIMRKNTWFHKSENLRWLITTIIAVIALMRTFGNQN